MKKMILLFIFIVFLAWFSQGYFSIILPTVKSISKQEKEERKSITPTLKNKLKIENNHEEESVTLSQLLKEDRFYDAMTYYLENTNKLNLEKMEVYLQSLANRNPSVSLEYMQIFLESVPESRVWKLMIATHIAQGNLEVAIELIIQAKENYASEGEDKRLSIQLKDTSVLHINGLAERKEYAKLITFLEDMIAYDNSDNFYKFRLAQLYMMLDKKSEAGTLFEELQYDEVYEQNVKSLLNTISKEEDEHYKYAIPLQRHGEHYAVNMFLDGSSFTLMLDTGATYILLDEEKASMLEVLRDDLILQTVGDDVRANLANVKEMKIGNLTLSNIEVTTAPFKRSGIDGLLGMNFFRQFSFFIDQEQSMLYLNPK